MKKILVMVSVLASLSMLQGCSAVMALNGQKEPDFNIIKRGQNKVAIEAQPLKPVSTERLANGNTVSLYSYTVGKEPNAGKAAVYVLLDLVTGFISELVTMPIELGNTSGDVRMLKVEYNSRGQVVRVG